MRRNVWRRLGRIIVGAVATLSHTVTYFKVILFPPTFFYGVLFHLFFAGFERLACPTCSESITGGVGIALFVRTGFLGYTGGENQF